jgi:hypothetical protein
MIASAAKAGGTKMIEVSAPTFATASATELNTGLVQVGLSSFSGSHSPYYIGSVFYHLGGVKGPFTSRKSLNNDF